MYIKGVEQFISKLKTNELNRKQKIIGILSDGQSVRKSVAREDDFIKQLYCKPITY